MVYNKSKISRETGISRQTIIKILAGKQKNPKIDTLTKIAKSVNVPLETLILKMNSEKEG